MKLLHRTKDRSSEEISPEADAFIASAQDHFAHAFPNPGRAGCPGDGAIQAVVQSEQVPSDVLQAHLFGCSECFNEYRTAVRAWREQKKPAADLDWRAIWGTFWNWRTLAGATTALLLLSAGLWVWFASSPQSNQVRSQPSLAASVVAENIQPEPAGTISPTPLAGTRQSSVNKGSLLALNRDLNDYRSLGSQRRGGGEAESPIPLPRAYIRLLLTLPENSPAGSYRVSLLEDGRTRDAVTARSRNRQTLQIILDLRRVVGSQARLSIERAGQSDVSPLEYNVEITRP